MNVPCLRKRLLVPLTSNYSEPEDFANPPSPSSVVVSTSQIRLLSVGRWFSNTDRQARSRADCGLLLRERAPRSRSRGRTARAARHLRTLRSLISPPWCFRVFLSSINEILRLSSTRSSMTANVKTLISKKREKKRATKRRATKKNSEIKKQKRKTY